MYYRALIVLSGIAILLALWLDRGMWLFVPVVVLLAALWLEANRQRERVEHAEHKARTSIESYRTLFDSLTDAVVIEDSDGQVIDANPAAQELFSDADGSLWGLPASKLRVGEPQSGECTGRRLDGSEFPQEVRRIPINYFGMPAMLSVIRDITERKRASDLMAHQASHDLLTGLVNRHEFEARVERVLEDRRGHALGHALLYIDLDQFKVVNDTCGHRAGDELLRQVSTLMAQGVRESDTLARLGGDEFGVLLEDCTRTDAVQVADGLIARTNEFRFHWEDKIFTIGASIGLVVIGDDAETIESLFSAADSACYAAKELGRNRVVVHSAADEDLARRQGEMTMVTRITRAMQEGRFDFHFQRIRSISGEDPKDRIELLLRMQESDGTTVSPEVFIPAAERYNVMPALDRWALEHGVKGLARVLERSPGHDMLVAMNLSGTSLTSEKFTAFVMQLFERYDLPPGNVCFEITETTAISNLVCASEFIREMQALGCSIALDDFGSGLSSLAYLKKLPVDYLKIDGSFIRNIVDDTTDQAMVEAIVRVGQAVGVRTIAEFVDSASMVETLKSIGVDYVQGYAVHTPEPWLPPDY